MATRYGMFGDPVQAAYMRGEEADSNRPIAGLNPNKMGLLESMGIFSPAEKQYMDFAQQRADDLMQRQQDLQEAQMVDGLSSPAFYGIRAGRSLGGLLGAYAGGGADALNQQANPVPPQQQADPAYQLVQQVLQQGDPNNSLASIKAAGQALLAKGDPRGVKMVQYAQEAQDKLDKDKADIEQSQASARSSNATAAKTEKETSDPAFAAEGKVIDSLIDPQGNRYAGVIENGGIHRLNQGGIPTTNANNRNQNADVTPNQAGENINKFGDMVSVGMQGADITNDWIARVKANPHSAGVPGEISSKLLDLSSNVSGLVAMAASVGKKTDSTVVGALNGDLSNYASTFKSLGIDGALNQRSALALAYLLAAQDQKTASISDKDIENYLKLVGGKHSNLDSFLATMDANKEQMFNKVQYYALTHEDKDGKMLSDNPRTGQMLETLRAKMYPKGQSAKPGAKNPAPEGTIVNTPQGRKVKKGGQWVPYGG